MWNKIAETEAKFVPNATFLNTIYLIPILLLDLHTPKSPKRSLRFKTRGLRICHMPGQNYIERMKLRQQNDMNIDRIHVVRLKIP